MRKYRLGYDYLFVAKEPFEWNGRLIGSLSISVLFQVYESDGKEILFDDKDLKEQKIKLDNGQSCYISNLIKCSIDTNNSNIFVFEPTLTKINYCSKDISFTFKDYSMDEVTLCQDQELIQLFNRPLTICEPISISEKEFLTILKVHLDLFDNSNNKPVQIPSYFIEEVEVD